MPTPRAFLTAFALKTGTVIKPQITAIKVGIGHDVVEQYRVYAFPLVVRLVTAKDVTKADALEAFQQYVATPRVVNSQYGNPYQCYIDTFHIRPVGSVDPHVHVYEVTAMGHGDRINR